MDQDQYFESAIKWAKKQGFQNIKANYQDYDTPGQFNQQGDDNAFIPDITGVGLGGKNYVEIAMKTENLSRTVSKWKLLSTMASIKGGKFYLLAPRGHKAFTVNIVEKHNLEARVVSI